MTIEVITARPSVGVITARTPTIVYANPIEIIEVAPVDPSLNIPLDPSGNQPVI